MADVAFHAWGKTLDGLFAAAADAMLNVMVEDLSVVAPVKQCRITAQGESEEVLLLSLLEELIYYKDAQRLLLRLEGGTIESINGVLSFSGIASGELIDMDKHHLAVDVKAVTMHLFSLYRKEDAWHCTVVLDI